MLAATGTLERGHGNGRADGASELRCAGGGLGLRAGHTARVVSLGSSEGSPERGGLDAAAVAILVVDHDGTVEAGKRQLGGLVAPELKQQRAAGP